MSPPASVASPQCLVVCTGTFIYNLKWRSPALIRYGGDLGVLAGVDTEHLASFVIIATELAAGDGADQRQCAVLRSAVPTILVCKYRSV